MKRAIGVHCLNGLARSLPCSGHTEPAPPTRTSQATYRRHRPIVEGSIAWVTGGNRLVPYRGVAKNNPWLHLRVGAIDLRRLLTLGLSTTDGQLGTGLS